MLQLRPHPLSRRACGLGRAVTPRWAEHWGLCLTIADWSAEVRAIDQLSLARSGTEPQKGISGAAPRVVVLHRTQPFADASARGKVDYSARIVGGASNSCSGGSEAELW